MVSIIIPAYNEEDTISEVITGIENHKWVDETIVVDDGSKDETAKRAENVADRVIKLPQNKGKATAMDHGVANAKNDIVCFLDADIKNLNKEILTRLLTPVVEKGYDMFVGICGRKRYKLSRFLIFLPVLGGQRVLTKQLWKEVPPVYKKDFQIELALNYFSKVTGRKMGITVLEDLDHIPKEKKYGLISGLLKRIQMGIDIFQVTFTLYVIETIKRKVSQLF
ncbi:MAG: glycosyltransferase family 2 protein [Candidatus Paceibacteria bacterium]